MGVELTSSVSFGIIYFVRNRSLRVPKSLYSCIYENESESNMPMKFIQQTNDYKWKNWLFNSISMLIGEH